MADNLRPRRNVALFEPVKHPILRGVDPKEVEKILRERQRYVDEVKEKMKEIPTMSLASYKVSIDRSLLSSMHFIGKFDEIAPRVELDKLTSEHIETFVKSIVEHQKDDEVNHKVIERGMKGLRMNMKIENPEARALQYGTDAFTRLEGVGYGKFREVNPKKTIELLQQNLFPPMLKKAMERQLSFQVDLTRDLKKYIGFLVEEAVIQDRVYESTRQFKDSCEKTDKSEQNTSHSHKDKMKSLLCLHPKCKAKGLRQYIVTECDEATPEEAKKLLDEHKKQNQRKQRDGKRQDARKVTRGDQQKSNTIQAIFAECEHRMLCADSGSDVNLLPPDLLASLLSKGANMNLKTLKEPLKFGLAAQSAPNNDPFYILCNREATMSVELLVRHGKSLKIWNIVWMVATADVAEPLLGRPLLEALGLDTKETLAAACDKFEGSVDAKDIMHEQQYANGSIARLLDTGIYHSDNAVEDDDTEEIDWLDLGEDTRDEIDSAIANLLNEAKANGLTDLGQEKLLQILERYRNVLRLRLGPGDGPAKVEPMHVTFKSGTTPFMTKARKYSADQRAFMDKYLSKLEEYGFIKENENATWASAALLFPKSGSAKYRLTFDLKPPNARTVPVAWPMPHLESELLDLAGSTVFATIDFCSGYWQLPLHEGSQEIHSVITPRGMYTPTRTLQGAMNSGANFSPELSHASRK